MDRTLALFAIGLVFGGGIGFVVAAGNAITFEGHDHGNPAQHAGTDSSDNGPATAHDMPLEVANADAPRVDVALTPDPNANDHRPYAVGGAPVRATTRLTVE